MTTRMIKRARKEAGRSLTVVAVGAKLKDHLNLRRRAAQRQGGLQEAWQPSLG